MITDKRITLWISIGIGLCGLSCIFVSTNPGLIVLFQKILETIGIGFFTTATINLLNLFLPRDKTLEHPKIIKLDRSQVDHQIYGKKYHAKEIDILGFSLKECLNEIVSDNRFAKRLINHSIIVKLAFVSPDAQAVKQRAIEDHNLPYPSLYKRQIQSVKNCVTLYEILQKEYKKARIQGNLNEPKGSLEIRLIYGHIPFTYSRYDNEIFWGLYLADRDGVHSPIFLNNGPFEINGDNENGKDSMFNILKSHFDKQTLNQYDETPKSKYKNLLMSLNVQGPWLNKKMVKKFLRSDNTFAKIS